MPAYKGTRLAAGESFSEVFPGYIDKGGGLFRKPFLHKKSGKQSNHYFLLKKCEFCGVDCLQNRSNAIRSSKAFCSQQCVNASRHSPDGSSKYKRGSAGGHVLEKALNHPQAKRGFVPQHRLRVEEHIGRFLLQTEVIHHINCVEDDNRIENLHVCSSISDHNMAHASLLECVDPLLRRGLLVFDRESGKYRLNLSI